MCHSRKWLNEMTHVYRKHQNFWRKFIFSLRSTFAARFTSHRLRQCRTFSRLKIENIHRVSFSEICSSPICKVHQWAMVLLYLKFSRSLLSILGTLLGQISNWRAHFLEDSVSNRLESLLFFLKIHIDWLNRSYWLHGSLKDWWDHWDAAINFAMKVQVFVSFYFSSDRIDIKELFSMLL